MYHKIGRNEPCHCGSYKKYKKCCFSKDKELNNPLQNVALFPIKECLINENWQDSGLATIVVIRKHGNIGHFSFVSFLVDIFCLGLKNVMSGIEVYEDVITNFINMYPENFTRAEYEKCRGVILGAIDYAKNLGFEPHNDWYRVKGFIESDRTYEINHEFGKDGKPFYIEGPDDDVEQIMKILEN